MFTIDTDFLAIAKLIDNTNNGKLMVDRIEDDRLIDAIPALVKKGWLRRATFMNRDDAIRLA